MLLLRIENLLFNILGNTPDNIFQQTTHCVTVILISYLPTLQGSILFYTSSIRPGPTSTKKKKVTIAKF